jgi:hypothetical protein
MRREFACRLGVCAAELRPETPLSRFLPSERRREFWRSAQRELAVRLPTLQLPRRIERTGNWLVLANSARALVVGLWLGAKWLAFPVAFAAMGAGYVVFRLATSRWATEHPDLETFGDVSRWLLARNMKKFRHQFGLQPTHDEIFQTLRALLIEQGVEPQRITPEASLAELLGEG